MIWEGGETDICERWGEGRHYVGKVGEVEVGSEKGGREGGRWERKECTSGSINPLNVSYSPFSHDHTVRAT